jgi:hypothetical protein
MRKTLLLPTSLFLGAFLMSEVSAANDACSLGTVDDIVRHIEGYGAKSALSAAEKSKLAEHVKEAARLEQSYWDDIMYPDGMFRPGVTAEKVAEHSRQLGDQFMNLQQFDRARQQYASAAKNFEAMANHAASSRAPTSKVAEFFGDAVRHNAEAHAAGEVVRMAQGLSQRSYFRLVYELKENLAHYAKSAIPGTPSYIAATHERAIGYYRALKALTEMNPKPTGALDLGDELAKLYDIPSGFNLPSIVDNAKNFLANLKIPGT